jgi:hypothetical protein
MQYLYRPSRRLNEKIPKDQPDEKIGGKGRLVAFEDDLERNVINAHIHYGLDERPQQTQLVLIIAKLKFYFGQ